MKVYAPKVSLDMSKIKYIMNKEELSRGWNLELLRRTDLRASRNQNQVIIQKYFLCSLKHLASKIPELPKAITICHSFIPFLNSSVDYRYLIPIPIGFLAHFPWTGKKKQIFVTKRMDTALCIYCSCLFSSAH